MGGGLKNLSDVEEAKAGADKVFINSGAYKNPNLIKKLIRIIFTMYSRVC